MKRKHFALGLALAIAAAGCEPTGPAADQTPATAGLFVLAEGNFQAGNASLWHWPAGYESDPTANVVLSLTGQPLGDTGQSLYRSGAKLYVVVNGSSTIDVLDISGDTTRYDRRISLPGASPREMVVSGDRAYVTAWGNLGVLVLDLLSDTVTDTIALGGRPEGLALVDTLLYVAVPLSPQWATLTRVVAIQTGSLAVADTIDVGFGPQQLEQVGQSLVVSRQWYDSSFNSLRGMARIDLANGAVTSVDWGAGGGTDLLVVGAQLWAATATGAVPVGENLMPETGSAIAIAGGTAYSAGTDGTHIIIGSYATFSEPGTVRVFTTDGTIVASALVGLGPGDMVYVSP